MLRIFAGYDAREALGFHVFVESLIRHASEPVSIIPLTGTQRDGTNAFTYARFLVPHLCGFEGTAIFMDASDMLMRADIAEITKYIDARFAVQVVKHHYWTRHERKYIGTDMEADNADYPKKNWSSVMIWNCEHPANQLLTPAFIESKDGAYLHRFSWLMDNQVGGLPPQWNVLIGEQSAREPKVAHFTLGIPAIDHYKDWDFAREWAEAASQVCAVPSKNNVFEMMKREG